LTTGRPVTLSNKKLGNRSGKRRRIEPGNLGAGASAVKNERRLPVGPRVDPAVKVRRAIRLRTLVGGLLRHSEEEP
jgi:hypothetical protein